MPNHRPRVAERRPHALYTAMLLTAAIGLAALILHGTGAIEALNATKLFAG